MHWRRRFRLDASHEFPYVEWLPYVGICTDFKADDFIDGFTASREQENRGVDPLNSKVLAEVEAVAVVQHDVEDDQVERQRSSFFESTPAISGEINNVAFPL
jgi:hypothetical protein